MKEEVINGIKYRLDEEILTAEVIELKDDLELDETKMTAEKLMKMIFNGYEGDVIIPETVVFNERTYRVTSIGEKAFAGSYSLKSVTIPDSVTSIGEKAFNDCKKLKSIVIPDAVTSIGEYAFVGCESLTTKVEIGEKIIDGIKYLLYCNRTAKVIQKSTRYKGDIIIPETVEFKGITYRVTSIGAETFTWCEKLKSIVIPNSITSIGDRAFYQCTGLTSITIPESVTSIGKRAFENCKKLTSVIIPDGVKSIGDMTFSWCFALTEIVIPNSVKSIGDEAFECCFALTEIKIPDSVTSIGTEAFGGCKSLTSITFQGTIAQWEEIELSDGWNDEIPAKVVHCTDGDVEI